MIPDINTIILYEDPQIIVCHKPAGLAVQNSRIGSQDLESLLKNHIAGNISKGRSAGSGHSRSPYLAVIHRLDQPVEGLIVFAKTQKAAKDLNRQLTSSGFGKYYLAQVTGCPGPAEGTLENYMVKDARTNTSRICSKDTPGSKPARLHYKVLKTEVSESGRHTSLVEICLDTGRHHQIRVQMAHIGCPIAGDRKYGDKESTGPLRLCAYRLEFRHPDDGRTLKFELAESDLSGFILLI